MTHPHLRLASALSAEGWSSHDLGRAVRAGTLIRLTRGIYAPADEIPLDQQHLRRAAALASTHRRSAVLSHESAALVHGLPLPSSDPGRVHLTVPLPASGRRTPHLHLHAAPLDADDVMVVDGLAVTSLHRTVLDLTCTMSYAWAVVVADHALARGVPRAVLLDAAAGAGRRAGIRQSRRVLAFADGRAQSPAESASRVSIARAGLPAPILQHTVVGPHGVIAITDFGWPGHGLVGEVDGKTKYTRLLRDGETAGDAVLADKRREEAIRQAGWWISRWGWSEAWDAERLGRLLRGAMNRTAHGSAPRK